MESENEIWNARRKSLEEAVITATLNLFAHMGSAGAFKLPIKGTKPEVYVIAGEARAVKNLVNISSSDPGVCENCSIGNHVSCHGLTICQCDTCYDQIREDALQDKLKDREEE